MLKEILKKLGVEYAEDISDEDAKALIEQKIDEKDNHITNLESEKQALSDANQELTTSVEGYKSSQEKLDKELSETKGKLAQITDMYKEQFTKDPEQQEASKDDKALKDDVLQQILDTH